MPGNAAKGLVTTGPKLRVDMPEMNVPTKMVSMLETFWSLRNTTGTSASEPTTEQLLKDYKMHSGISLGTISTLPSLPPHCKQARLLPLVSRRQVFCMSTLTTEAFHKTLFCRPHCVVTKQGGITLVTASQCNTQP